MGKLIDKLERAALGTITPLGFGVRGPREQVAPMLLIGSAQVGNKGQAQQIASAGVDVALLTMAKSLKKASLATFVKALGDLPWGVWQESDNAGPADGSDFQVVASEAVALSALGDEESTNIMVIPPEMEDATLRTIEELPMDAFLVPLSIGPLTVRHLMEVARVRSVTGKYILAQLSIVPGVQDLRQLRDAGVNGLVMDMASVDAEAVKECAAQLLDLEPSKPPKHSERTSAILPSIRSAAPSRHEEDDDDDDEYDE